MNKNKKFLSLALTLAICASTAVTAMAAPGEIGTAGGPGNAEAVVTAAGITFSVTVPTELPVNVDADGVVATSTDVKITNNSAGAVKVSNVTFAAKEGWKGIEYGSDMSSKKVGTKEIGFKLNDCVTNADGALGFNGAKFPSIAAKNDTASDELGITYDATLPAQAVAIAKAKVADVVFTVGWDLETPVEAPVE